MNTKTMKIIVQIITLIFLSGCQKETKCVILNEHDLTLNNKSEKEYENGNIDNALEITEQAIKLNPKNYIAFSNRAAFNFEKVLRIGMVSMEIKKIIIDDFNHSLEICNKFSIAQRNLIKFFYYIKDYDMVINYSKDYNLKFEKSSEVLTRLGDALLKKGDKERALKYLNDAININTISHFSYGIRGKCHVALGDYSRAIEDLNKSIEIDSTWSFAYQERGYSYKMQKKIKLAQKDYFKALDVDSLRIEPYYSLGVIEIEKGDSIEGCRYFQLAMNNYKRNKSLDRPKKIELQIIKQQRKFCK